MQKNKRVQRKVVALYQQDIQGLLNYNYNIQATYLHVKNKAIPSYLISNDKGVIEISRFPQGFKIMRYLGSPASTHQIMTDIKKTIKIIGESKRAGHPCYNKKLNALNYLLPQENIELLKHGYLTQVKYYPSNYETFFFKTDMKIKAGTNVLVLTHMSKSERNYQPQFIIARKAIAYKQVSLRPKDASNNTDWSQILYHKRYLLNHDKPAVLLNEIYPIIQVLNK